MEDALSVGAAWTVVAGLRRDRVDLDRTILDQGAGARSAYAQRYDPRSVRLGLLYAMNGNTSVHAQTSDATSVDSGNLLLLSAASSAFDLSRARQQEVGIKRASAGSRLQANLTLYRIVLDNVRSGDASSPALTVNNGSQSSRGVELTADWRIGRQWNASGNAAWLDARFDRLIEASNLSRAGNLPPNVAKRTANAWLDYRFAQLPLKAGIAASHVGERYGNNANTLRMDAYTSFDAYATWRLDAGDLTLRVRNLGDKVYAVWSGANANNQVILGAPRSVDVTLLIVRDFDAAFGVPVNCGGCCPSRFIVTARVCRLQNTYIAVLTLVTLTFSDICRTDFCVAGCVAISYACRSFAPGWVV